MEINLAKLYCKYNEKTEKKRLRCTYLRHTLDIFKCNNKFNKYIDFVEERKKDDQFICLCFVPRRKCPLNLLTCIGSLCGSRLIRRLVVARSLCIVCRSCCCRCNRIACLLLRWISWSSCSGPKSQQINSKSIRIQQMNVEPKKCIAIDFE